jgi:predicted dehydrogenase
MSGAPVRLGLVGCGRIAERGYVAALGGLSDVAVTAVADPDPRRAEALARRLGAAVAHPGAEPMIDAGRVDALVVAAPAEHHLPIARLAAAAGLPSLVEKPPAPDLAGAIAMSELAVPPVIGFNRRFLQGKALEARVPARGWLDLELELRFRRGGWGAHVSRDEALLDAGTHLIDLACYLTGSEPIAVREASLGPERASLSLELGRGRARLSCATDSGYRERVVARDSGGRVHASHSLGGLRTRAARLRGAPDPLALSLRRQLDAFAGLVRGAGPGPLATAADGVRAMGVVEAARRSAGLDGSEVTVERVAAAGATR